jgi:hypothetical protein
MDIMYDSETESTLFLDKREEMPLCIIVVVFSDRQRCRHGLLDYEKCHLWL